MNTLVLQKKKINIKNLNYLFYIPIGLLSFFITNISVLKTINPFISIYLSILLGNKNSYKFYIGSFFIILGILINNTSVILLKNIFIFFLMQLINIYLIKTKYTLNVFNRAVTSSVCLLISNLLLIYIYNLGSFYLVNSLFEASLAFILTLVMYKGVLILDTNKLSYLKKITVNEGLSLVLFITTILLGMQSYTIGSLNIQFIFFTFLILIVSNNFGSSQSILVSFIYVFVTGILINSDVKTYGYMILLSSVLAGVSKKRYFNILGYGIGILIMYLYYFIYNISVIPINVVLTNFIIGGIIFYILPENFINFSYSAINKSKDFKSDYIEFRIKEQLNLINKLRDIFKNQYLFLKSNKLDEEISTSSLNLRLVSANYLLYQQYNYFKDNMENLIMKDKYEYKHSLERKIVEHLKENSFLIENISVFLNQKGVYEVYIKKHNFSMLTKSNIITNLLNEIMPITMILLEEKDNTLHFVEKYKFNIINSIATLKKGQNELSGDTFSILQSDVGEVTLTLCDGMGSGDIANKHSTLTIELFEDLINSKFDKKVAIDILNSMLLIREDGEFFSSLDCTTINKYTGVLKTYKLGASATYILRNNKIETITSKSLPIGILNNIEIDISDMQLEKGDIVIMMTDGVVDSNYSVKDKENYLSKKLINCSKKTPQGIANYLIEETKKQTQGEVLDDCTILVSKIL